MQLIVVLSSNDIKSGVLLQLYLACWVTRVDHNNCFYIAGVLEYNIVDILVKQLLV